MQRDVFISHASEDKDAIARPLAVELLRRGHSVWFDEYELVLGDSLRTKLGEGLRYSRVGVVILSRSFFAKRWPQWELDGLTSRQIAGEPNVVIPIWHEVSVDDVRSYSSPLADLVAANSDDGTEAIADGISRVLLRLAAGAQPNDVVASAGSQAGPGIGAGPRLGSLGSESRPQKGASVAPRDLRRGDPPVGGTGASELPLPAFRTALPEAHLRALSEDCRLDQFFATSPQREDYLRLFEEQLSSYRRHVGQAPSPAVLRNQIAAIIGDRDDLIDHVRLHMPRALRQEAWRKEVMNAASGTLIDQARHQRRPRRVGQ